MLERETQFLVQINYKSGITTEAWFREFSIKNGDYKWNSVDTQILILGVTHIESVRVLKARKRFA